MTDHAAQSVPMHRWYARPVLFVTDLKRALQFYLDRLGFTKIGMKTMGKALSARSVAVSAR